MTLLIADDNYQERELLHALFSAEMSELLPIYQAENGEEAVNLVERYKPDITLMDIEMPEKSGIQAARTIFTNGGSRIIFFSQHSDQAYLRELSKLVPPAFSWGYVLKDSPDETVLAAVREVLDDRIYLDERITAKFRSVRKGDFTKLELQTIIGTALGLSDSEIADRMQSIAPCDISRRLSAIYCKLNLPANNNRFHRRTRLISICIQSKLFSEELLAYWEQSILVQGKLISEELWT